MTRFFVSIFFSILFFSANSQVVTDSTYKLPINEKLHYKVYYKLSKIWINAGLANFETDTLRTDSTVKYRFVVEGYSLHKYNWIFSLEDHYKSTVNYNTLMPVRFEKENTEQGVWVHNIYNFRPDENSIDIFMESTGKQPEHKRVKHSGFITDALSASYYIRTWDYNSFSNGDTLTFATILDGKIFDQSMVYLGKDTITSKRGENIPSIKLSAVIENSTFFRGNNAIIVWITDDKYRRIIKAKASIIVGSIVAYLDKQGLVSFGPE